MLEFGLGVSKLASRGFGIKRIEVESIMTCSNPDEVEAGIPEPGSGHSFHDITVVVHDVKLVQPADATKEETMYLTNIDLTLVETVECFYVFLNNKDRSSENVFSVLEDALARLLVPYHFMAGRLEVNLEEERLQVKCNRAGAGFLVASSEQTVEELGDLKLVNPNFGKLVPAPPSDDIRPVDDFLLMVQVSVPIPRTDSFSYARVSIPMAFLAKVSGYYTCMTEIRPDFKLSTCCFLNESCTGDQVQMRRIHRWVPAQPLRTGRLVCRATLDQFRQGSPRRDSHCVSRSG